MVTRSDRRAAVAFLRENFGLTERRACRLVSRPRATQQYRVTRLEGPELSQGLIALANERRRFGYPRFHLLLRREGFVLNRKHVYRLYCEGGLKLQRKRGLQDFVWVPELISRPSRASQPLGA